MRAVVAHSADQLAWEEVPDVQPGPGEVVLRVRGAGVNRADLLQAAGHYPPPPGASQILGMEASGVIAEVGEGVAEWAVGQEVCALLAGGGYAQFVAVPAPQVMPIPRGVDIVEAAAKSSPTGFRWRERWGPGSRSPPVRRRSSRPLARSAPTSRSTTATRTSSTASTSRPGAWAPT